MKFTVDRMDVLTVQRCIVIPVPLCETETVLELKKKLDEGKPLSLELKPLRRARTLSANAFCWILCDEIAKALSKNGTYTSKEDVYRKAIEDCGTNTYMKFASHEAKEEFAKRWKQNGIGWVTQDIGNNELLVYFGSSTYDRSEMSRLIECLVAEAKEQGIKVKASAEIEQMIEEWGRMYGKKHTAE